MENQVKSDKEANDLIDRHLESKIINEVKRKKEREYIRAKLMHYINQQAETERVVCGGFGCQIDTNRDTELRLHCVDYVVRCFTLYELDLLFFVNNHQYGMDKEFIRQAKGIAIDNITNDDYYNGAKARRLIKKIRDMNPIVFGLLHEIIQESSIFWEVENAKYVFPHEYFPRKCESEL